MHPTNPIVTVRDERPVLRPEGGCGYCTAALGAPHDATCVARVRTVVVTYHVTIVETVPSHWSAADIESHHNESSWCAGNAIDRIVETAERLEANRLAYREGRPFSDDRHACPCAFVEATFTREATAEDEVRYGVFADTPDT